MARIDFKNSYQFDRDAHKAISETVEDNSKLLDEVVDSIVKKYSKELDDVINQAHSLLHNNNQLADQEIEYFILSIPIQLYYSSNAQEAIGIREDVAKMIRQRLYIEARQNATGTVEDKNTAADKHVTQETLTAAAYNRASRMLKAKNETALEVLSAFKKVISRRMEEYQLSRFGGSSE